MHPLLAELQQFYLAYIEANAGPAATKAAFEKLTLLAQQTVAERPRDMDVEQLQRALDVKEQQLMEALDRANASNNLCLNQTVKIADLEDDLAEAKNRASIANEVHKRNGYLDRANSHLIQALAAIDSAHNV